MDKREEQHVKKLIQKFKEFAMCGNVIDPAVGIIIGGVSGQIISSLVKDVIIPVLSIITGETNLGKLVLTIPDMFGGADIVIAYGAFLQNVLDFMIIASVIFIMIKLTNKLRQRKGEELAAEPETPVLSKEEEFLIEIRDSLKENNKA